MIWAKKNKIIHLSVLAVLVLVLLLSFVQITSAQLKSSSPTGSALESRSPTPSSSGKLQNPLNIENIEDFLSSILKAVVNIATPIIVLMIIYSGFLFVKAQGNPEELNTAKKTLMWVIIGAIIILGAAVLQKAISGTITDLQKGVQSEYIIKLG